MIFNNLLSDNLPISIAIDRYFVGIENIVQKLWMIENDPTTYDKIPVELNEIHKCRNKLGENVLLLESPILIAEVNRVILPGRFTSKLLVVRDVENPKLSPEDLAPIPMIKIAEDLAKRLDYATKWDRFLQNINRHRLIQDGEKQGKKFVEARLKPMGVS